jgi:integrase
VKGSTFKRCGCRDASGRLLGQGCPKLRSTKHGTWYYQLRVAGRPNPYKRGGFPSAREANAALDDLRVRLRGGLMLHHQTVGEWLDEWIAAKRRLRPNTARSYAGHVDRYLRPHLGHIPLESLGVGHVAAMFEAITADNAHRDRPVGPTTMHRIRATLRAALNGAIRQRLLNVNVASLVELPPPARFPVRLWSPAQVGAFLDATASDRLYAVFHVVVAAGLRRGEVCGLRWDDVDLDAGSLCVVQQLVSVAGRVHVAEPKTARGVRVVALDPGTVAVLGEHRRRQLGERAAWGAVWTDTGLVFGRENGTRLDPALVSRHFARLSHVAGLPPIRLHDLRHTSASIGLSAGESMKEISDRLGHSSITLTMNTYTHVAPVLAAESARRRAALIPRAPARTSGESVPTLCPQADPDPGRPPPADAFPQVRGLIRRADARIRTGNLPITSRLRCQIAPRRRARPW